MHDTGLAVYGAGLAVHDADMAVYGDDVAVHGADMSMYGADVAVHGADMAVDVQVREAGDAETAGEIVQTALAAEEAELADLIAQVLIRRHPFAHKGTCL